VSTHEKDKDEIFWRPHLGIRLWNRLELDGVIRPGDGLPTKKAVRDAIRLGVVKPAPNYGVKSHRELCRWAGIKASSEIRVFVLVTRTCPRCRGRGKIKVHKWKVPSKRKKLSDIAEIRSLKSGSKSCNPLKSPTYKVNFARPDGGTGRHTGLKIVCERTRSKRPRKCHISPEQDFCKIRRWLLTA
jgi:hypothetical protein